MQNQEESLIFLLYGEMQVQAVKPHILQQKVLVNSLTKALAKELAPSGICVNAIACGAIDTDMNSFLSDEDKLSLFEEIPAGRMGRPDEAGKLAVMLADAPSYLTGQIITLDGAWI